LDESGNSWKNGFGGAVTMPVYLLGNPYRPTKLIRWKYGLDTKDASVALNGKFQLKINEQDEPLKPTIDPVYGLVFMNRTPKCILPGIPLQITFLGMTFYLTSTGRDKWGRLANLSYYSNFYGYSHDKGSYIESSNGPIWYTSVGTASEKIKAYSVNVTVHEQAYGIEIANIDFTLEDTVGSTTTGLDGGGHIWHGDYNSNCIYGNQSINGLCELIDLSENHQDGIGTHSVLIDTFEGGDYREEVVNYTQNSMEDYPFTLFSYTNDAIVESSRFSAESEPIGYKLIDYTEYGDVGKWHAYEYETIEKLRYRYSLDNVWGGWEEVPSVSP
jgi:hypothetical protein